MGFDAPINVCLAWGYVGLRIVHSIVQATVNMVTYRFLFFALLAMPDRPDDPCRAIFLVPTLKQAASSTWVDQRNCPTGCTQSSA